MAAESEEPSKVYVTCHAHDDTKMFVLTYSASDLINHELDCEMFL